MVISVDATFAVVVAELGVEAVSKDVSIILEGIPLATTDLQGALQ